MVDQTSGYAEMRSSVAVTRGTREAVEAVGEDAATFLQGQLSQDVAGMAVGASVWSLLLAPQGKIDAWIRVTRLDENRFILDVDAGWAEAVVTRLTRFRLRTKCDLVHLPWQSVSLRGPDSPLVSVAGAEVSAEVEWAGVPGMDYLGPELTVPSEVVTASGDAFTALRIEAGEPAMGSEMDESTIPAAAGIVDRSVSFTKGCYTGQELVARIDSRGGNVPQRLVGVSSATDSSLAVGMALVNDGKSVGRVTSVAVSPGRGRRIGLAYLARGIDDDAVAANQELATDADVSVTLHALPFTTS